MLLTFLLAAAPPVSPPWEGPWPADVPRPIGASPIEATDYPADALRSGAQGIVRAALNVNARGRVTGCTILGSSGSASLDAATCRIMAKRARFTAAHDIGGRTVPSFVLERVTWRIGPGGAPQAEAAPDAYRGPSLREIAIAQYFSVGDYPAEALRKHEQGTVSFRLQLDANGRITACTVTGSSGSASLDAATCAIAQRRARFVPARDAAGNAVPASVTTYVQWKIRPR
jgi:TonB family protein